MDVRMMSLYVNLCGMILNAYIHLPYVFAVGLNVKGKSIFKV